ncbi:hypothetical protein [Dendronalium sp. ChiSLP03b]|uniref:hypothetical protein n=1 Tax=Dendronalium sp. ChiSLP03b TaxID=3075381 RepID=UPI002AD3E1C2|nr:hypothetical protein [Dendronalium sp. ChiSLP03b]MDZ8206559.1 hypothetical protein [Dendronalium sp. ChiSLP03b]
MKLTKKASLFVYVITSIFISNVVIKSIYILTVQAVKIVQNGSFELKDFVDHDNPNISNFNIIGWTKSEGDKGNKDLIKIDNFPALMF